MNLFSQQTAGAFWHKEEVPFKGSEEWFFLPKVGVRNQNFSRLQQQDGDSPYDLLILLMEEIRLTS